MTAVLLAAGEAVATVLGLGVVLWGAWGIVVDRPLNAERSTSEGGR